MAEFEQHLADVQKNLQKSRYGYNNSLDYFLAAEQSYEAASRVRENMLQNTLKEKGLAVCSVHHFFSGTARPEEWRTRSAEELGIYPRDRLRLRYMQGMLSSTEHFTMVTSEWMKTEVLLLCPGHFSQAYIDVFGTEDVPKIYSEVVQKDGKFIVMKNGADITELVNKGRSPQSKIEPDGDTHPDLAVYRYFGIPDLSERPSMNSVRLGR